MLWETAVQKFAHVLIAAALALGLSMSCTHQQAARVDEPEARCASLGALSDARLVIRETEFVADGVVTMGFPPPGQIISTAPHCRVRGAINPRTGEGGRSFEIGFELRLPAEWNGRFLFQGGGGLDGFVQPALGMLGGDAPPALAQGFAVVSTDAGHQGGDASFASDPQARIDYAYNALDVVARDAQSIVRTHYGRAAEYSYFVGCSNGGRQGMLATQRFPELFDGVVAGNPGFRLSRAAIGEMWDNAQFARVSPRTASGQPIISRAFSDAELRLVSDAVLEACDALDGLADGLIQNQAACVFDPSALACRESAQGNCLSAEKVDVLRSVFEGAHDSRGGALYASWPYDTGIAEPGWRIWKLGMPHIEAPSGINQTMGLDAFARYFATPPLVDFDFETFNFDTAASLVADTGAINDAVSTDLTAWNARGGKLIIYQGVSDPVFSANDIAIWYETAAASRAGNQSTRLFMVPGMNHCGGGRATDQFDAFSALQDWVERGRAPDRIIARGASFPGATRPLCPYPSYAHYSGGDASDASSFTCRAPN